MKRIRLQNEKIKQRRLVREQHLGLWNHRDLRCDQDVEADKAAFQKTQEEERAKQARNRQVQADINKKREEVARRKMEKAQNREWDSGKPAATRATKNWAQEVEKEKAAPQKDATTEKQEATDEKPAATDDKQETTDDGWAKEGATHDGWDKQPATDASWDKQVEKEESQVASSGWDTLGEYADVEIPPEPEKPAGGDEGWGAPADPADNSGQWTRGGSPNAFRSRGGGRGRGGRGRGRGRGRGAPRGQAV